MQLLELPVELFHDIWKEIVGDPDNIDTYRNNLSALSRFSRTCRAVNIIATPILYHTARIDHFWSGSTPQGKLVRHFSMFITPSGFEAGKTASFARFDIKSPSALCTVLRLKVVGLSNKICPFPFSTLSEYLVLVSPSLARNSTRWLFSRFLSKSSNASADRLSDSRNKVMTTTRRISKAAMCCPDSPALAAHSVGTPILYNQVSIDHFTSSSSEGCQWEWTNGYLLLRTLMQNRVLGRFVKTLNMHITPGGFTNAKPSLATDSYVLDHAALTELVSRTRLGLQFENVRSYRRTFRHLLNKSNRVHTNVALSRLTELTIRAGATSRRKEHRQDLDSFNGLLVATSPSLASLTFSWACCSAHPCLNNQITCRLVNLTVLKLVDCKLCNSCFGSLVFLCRQLKHVELYRLEEHRQEYQGPFNPVHNEPTVREALDCLQPCSRTLETLGIAARVTYDTWEDNPISQMDEGGFLMLQAPAHEEDTFAAANSTNPHHLPTILAGASETLLQDKQEVISTVLGFPHLKRLAIKYAHIRHSRNQLAKLIRNCPNLEVLTVFMATRVYKDALKRLAKAVSIARDNGRITGYVPEKLQSFPHKLRTLRILGPMRSQERPGIEAYLGYHDVEGNMAVEALVADICEHDVKQLESAGIEVEFSSDIWSDTV
ncbi:hypothetical protein QBC35DRAFT_478320 [Podospora australis]|uniref:F-box domain-containing protein n=1 Tax=Podospora australis TaxID=1536484 RepID=A0AAN7AET1_9PEZI|nr:hypothetical protein QBC35DRAFT_478320 [Podospora australis]